MYSQQGELGKVWYRHSTHAQDWRVREAGFIQAEHDLEKGVWADKGDAVSGAQAAIYAVRKCVTDKIANVK